MNRRYELTEVERSIRRQRLAVALALLAGALAGGTAVYAVMVW